MTATMGRRLSEWERLDRKVKVTRRDVASAQSELDKFERQLAMIDTGEMRTTDREYFARKHSGALVKLRTLTGRLHEAEAELTAHEESLAKFRPEEPLPEDHELPPADEVSSIVSEIKRRAELERPA